MKTLEIIEKLRAYADLFEVANHGDDFDEDLEALKYLLLAAADRLEKHTPPKLEKSGVWNNG